MALLAETQPRSFGLHVTHVDGDGYFLRISGQLDQQCPLMIESLFDLARDQLEKGIGSVPPAAIREGVICAAKYKDGAYYRAKIVNTTNLATGQVGVHFIDYGNKDIISVSAIRFLDNYDPLLLQVAAQSSDYYLSRLMHPSGRWEEPLLLKLQSLLCYSQYPVTVEAQTRTIPLIAIQFKGNDLATHLVSSRLGTALPLAKQEVLLMQSENSQQVTNWQPSYVNDPPPFTEHVPFYINQNFPSNPASAMRLQQNVAMPFNGSVPPPSLVSQRLLVNKASRVPVNPKAPMRQPLQTTLSSPVPVSATPPTTPVSSAKPQSPKRSSTYKSRLLDVNSQHKVFVSYAEEGPELFAVQLVTDAKRLQDMMDDINKRPHSSLSEPPMIGTVCLGRMSGDRIICRAIVVSLTSMLQCKLFFVDFGDTDMVSYYDIFDIPEEFVKPYVFATRFCLSGMKGLEKGPHLNETFKQLVNGKVLTLKVVTPEGPPLIQYGELYMDNKNVLDLLLANMKDQLQFKWMDMLSLGSINSVLVSYVDSCIKFYIQLSDNIDDLNAVMAAVKVHCESGQSPGELPVGAACCARFPDDDNWYRARIRDTKGSKVVVAYVDYGNEQEIDVSDLRTITPDLIRLPAQAMKCALKGFENKPVETKTSNQLEMLALEKTLTAHIVGVLSNDTMLVSLVDDTVSPPLDVARRMTQLSQPRSNLEVKATTPLRKDAPESFSSPESPEDNRQKGFRREKSFKEERRPPREANEDFAQRGGSFRSREAFERSGPTRHSDRTGGRPDKGDRRVSSKPWEDNAAAAPPVPVDDEWEETPAQQSNYQPPHERPKNRDRDSNRDNRDRDNNRESDKFNQQDEREDNKTDDGGNRNSRDNRGDRRDYRGDRRDNRGDRQDTRGDRQDTRGDRQDNRGDRQDYRGDRQDNRGERQDNWANKRDNRESFQKREYKDNNRERGDRTRSNFTPRDRAERSFESDCDKTSDKSFKTQDNEGRAPPYKSRSKFTQVQYKELSDPIDLTTPFEEPVVETGAQHEVSVTWIISPENFYTQILSLQPKFLEMMHKIPEMYKGVKSFTGEVPVGSSVLARYPADGVLYRATVVSTQPFNKFIVRYVDFGNKQLVDAKDIWQLDRQLMELPKMAVHCSLLGVAPKDGEWKANPDIDLCFNGPRYQCVFQDYADELWKVTLWNNGASIADMLVEKELAIMAAHQSSVALKDEAIDLTIIVGQQILCRVTNVESFEKFHMQLDLDKAGLVESAIANFDTSKLTPLPADSLAEGIHCTVNHDGKIYRAVIENVSGTENIQAALPDYGNVINTSLSNLMILPTELSVYYYQALECCLHNYSAESKTLVSLEELKARLVGNKFIVYVNDVDGIRVVSTLYDMVTGQKVAIFEPDEGAYDEVVQLCTRAVFNYNFGMAYIAHSESLNEFYLQKAADSDRIALLLDELYKFYEEGTPEGLTSFEADGLCAAKSSDGNWYRATIVSAEETEVKVQFPDYGNTETLPKESLKTLDPKFFEPCSLALVASLGLIAIQDDALTKLTEWTTDKEVQVTLAFGSDGWLASLHLDGVDLSLKLVNEKLATPQVSSTEEDKAEPQVEEDNISLPVGCTQVYISHIDTPGHFWLQMADKVDKIEEIQANLQLNAESYADVENREMGTLCVAKYLADEQWYRAVILDADSDITTIRFVDYGNTDVLDNQPGLIKVMPDHLKEVELYAVKSSVNAIPTGTGEWSEPASEYFTQLVGDLSAPVHALIVLKDVTTYVDIFVNGQNLTDKLVSNGHATKSETRTECGDLPSCFASHINSPSEFWIQIESATPELQAMEAAMVDAENFPVLEGKEEGVICAAKYPEDDAWYRAQVIVDGSEGTEVLFMDYGNASIANELRCLPDELKVKPALSRKCALQKPRDIKSWSRKSEVKFNELAAEGATIFNVQFIASGDISIIELYLEGKSVTEELVELCEELPPAERPTPVGQDLRTSGKICYVNSLDEFYVQLDDFEAELDNVTARLNDAAEFQTVSELKVGSLCAAFWDEDEQWYRAKIIELCDSGYHVQFLDYGNKAKCEEIRQLPDDLAVIEPAAKCCSLAGFGNDSTSNESAKAKFDELAADVTATFQIEFLDSTKEPALVKVFLNNKDVTTIITSDVSKSETITEATVVSKDTVTEPDAISSDDKESNTLAADPGAVISEKVIAETKDVTVEEFYEDSSAVIDAPKEPNEASSAIAAGEKVIDVRDEPCDQISVIKDVKTTETGVLTSDKGSTDIIPRTVTPTRDDRIAGYISLHVSTDLILEPGPNNTDIDNKDIEPETRIELATCTEKFVDDELCTELNTSQPDLDESIDSSKTVIENKSFEANADTLIDDNDIPGEAANVTPEKDTSYETVKDDILSSPEKDISSETMNNSNETNKTPERDDSKDSLNTDTGYTSGGDHDKTSPTKESNSNNESPTKESESQKKEIVADDTTESKLRIEETATEIDQGKGEEVPGGDDDEMEKFVTKREFLTKT